MLFYITKCDFYYVKYHQLLGDFVPQIPTGVSPDSTGGLSPQNLHVE